MRAGDTRRIHIREELGRAHLRYDALLQQPKVDDFVLATGQLHSVAQLVAEAFGCVKLNWQDYVRYDAGLISSVEPVAPCGNPAKAKKELGWENTVSFKDMIALLVDSEMRKIA